MLSMIPICTHERPALPHPGTGRFRVQKQPPVADPYGLAAVVGVVLPAGRRTPGCPDQGGRRVESNLIRANLPGGPAHAGNLWGRRTLLAGAPHGGTLSFLRGAPLCTEDGHG